MSSEIPFLEFGLTVQPGPEAGARMISFTSSIRPYRFLISNTACKAFYLVTLTIPENNSSIKGIQEAYSKQAWKKFPQET